MRACPPLLALVPEADRPFYHVFTSTFKIGKVISFRSASSKFLEVFGNNQQNVADETRRMFVPPPGFAFNQNDLEGAEAVAVAMLCKEGHLRTCVRLGVKIHNFLCIKLFPEKFAEYLTSQEVEDLVPASLKAHENYKLIVKKCKSLPVEYGLAKRTVHGAGYCEGWQTFQSTVLKETRGRVVLDAATSKRLLNAYLTLVPEVREYQVEVENKIKQLETICNLFGHPARFVQRFTSSLARMGVSWGPQSTVGVMMLYAAVKHQEMIDREKLDWHLHNIVHDSALQSAPISEAEYAATSLAKNMTFELISPVDGWKFSIGVEKQVGMNWGKYDETENPAGLKVIT